MCSTPFRLLYVVNDAGFFLSHRLPLARGAREAGLDVHVATPPSDAVASITAQGFPHHPIALSRSGKGVRENTRTLVDLVRLYRRLRPALVHHVTIKPVLFGSMAARLTRVPAVINAPTGLGTVYLQDGAADRALRQVVRTAYRILLNGRRSLVLMHNPEDSEQLVRERIVPRERLRLVGGAGVDLAAFAPTPEPTSEPPLVVLAARLIALKGVRVFVDAARLLRGQGVAGRFALVGSSDPGNPSAITPDELAAWGREGVVEVWGQRSDMPRVYGEAAVVCLPSFREGLPKTLLEAAACARPMVAADVPGCREIVRHGENGLLVPPRDAPALAAALGTLLGDRELRRRMGARARELVGRFGERRVVTETVSVYWEVLR